MFVFKLRQFFRAVLDSRQSREGAQRFLPASVATHDPCHHVPHHHVTEPTPKVHISQEDLPLELHILQVGTQVQRHLSPNMESCRVYSTIKTLCALSIHPALSPNPWRPRILSPPWFCLFQMPYSGDHTVCSLFRWASFI